MKIAIFTETYLPDINGVVTHIKTLKDGLEHLGHEVLIVTADANAKRHIRSKNVMYCPAVKVKSIYNYDIANPLSMHRFNMIKKFNPDIIHIHNEFGIGISGAIIAALLKVPLVYTLHTMYDEYVYYIAKKRFTQSVTGGFIHNYARALAMASAAITGPSKKVEEFLRGCGVKKPVVIIPNSVELDKFNINNVDEEKAKSVRLSFNVKDDETLFGFCGRLGKEKNVSLLLDYFSKNVKKDDKIKLLIMGGGPMHIEHMKETEELGISDLVMFTGAVAHDELPVYYRGLDAYITASLSDTCSISMLEGMAMNLPVLHIYDPLNAGQVVDSVNGYIYHDGNEMYEYMKKIRDMPKDELTEFGLKARESVINSGADRLAKAVLDVYNSVLKKKRHRKLRIQLRRKTE